MRKLPVSLLLSCLALAGCGAKSALLKSQAGADLRCPAEQVVHESLAPYVEKVYACGRSDVYAYSHGEGRWVSPLDRASFDFSCPREELKSQHLGALSIGVSGCGKKGVYVLTPSGWLMNSVDERPQGGDKGPEQAGPGRQL